MPVKKYPSLEANYRDIIRQTIDNCILCGACIDSCPTFPLTDIKDKEIMQKVLDFLKEGKYSQDIFTKAYSCAGCGFCSVSCPQGLDPLLIHEALKVELIKQGVKPPTAFDFFLPGQKFNLHGILSALQTKPSELKWLRKLPAQPQAVENVVFLGCFAPALPHSIFAFLDILNMIGTDFVTLAGGELCCGTTYCPGVGKAGEAERQARELITVLKTFSPERLILTCTGCYREITEMVASFLEIDFQIQYYTDFLRDNLDKMKFTNPPHKSVVLHESCTSRRTNVAESAKKVLKSIPGLQLIESEELQQKDLCCGGIANTSYPEIGQKLGQSLAEELAKVKADLVATTCPFCRLTFYPCARQYKFNAIDVPTIINLSMGGREYEDKLQKLWDCNSVAEIIEISRENFTANGYTEEEMKNIIPLLFPFAAR